MHSVESKASSTYWIRHGDEKHLSLPFTPAIIGPRSLACLAKAMSSWSVLCFRLQLFWKRKTVAFAPQTPSCEKMRQREINGSMAKEKDNLSVRLTKLSIACARRSYLKGTTFRDSKEIKRRKSRIKTTRVDLFHQHV